MIETERRYEQVYKLITDIQRDLDKIRKALENSAHDEQSEVYKQIPGIEGIFDGFQMVADNGVRYDVPQNYAAKSRLVYGDRLKLVEENGGRVFKQIQKPPRKKIEGVLAKKEGKWFILADTGTYRISDVAADFNRAELGDKAVAIIPEDNLSAPYASLDKILKVERTAVSVNKAPQANIPDSMGSALRYESKAKPIKRTLPRVQETRGKPAGVYTVPEKTKETGETAGPAEKEEKPKRKLLGPFRPREKKPVSESKSEVATIAKTDLLDDDLR